jgi:hypothetical protein
MNAGHHGQKACLCVEKKGGRKTAESQRHNHLFHLQAIPFSARPSAVLSRRPFYKNARRKTSPP